jgi:hypothetical protein
MENKNAKNQMFLDILIFQNGENKNAKTWTYETWKLAILSKSAGEKKNS